MKVHLLLLGLAVWSASARADQLLSVPLSEADARTLEGLLANQTLLLYDRIYRAREVRAVKGADGAAGWSFDAVLDALAQRGELVVRKEVRGQGVAEYEFTAKDSCGVDPDWPAGAVRRLDFGDLLLLRGDRFVWLADAVSTQLPALKAHVSVSPPQVMKGGLPSAWSACAAKLERRAASSPLAGIELYDKTQGLKLDLRAPPGPKTRIALEAADSWTPARLKLEARDHDVAPYSLSARRLVSIGCDEQQAPEAVGSEPWQPVEGKDGDFDIEAFFSGAVPTSFEEKSKEFLQGRPPGCSLIVSQVELRVMRGKKPVHAIVFGMPYGC